MKKKLSRSIALTIVIVLVLSMFNGAGLAEQQSGEAFALDTLHHGFRVYQIEQLETINTVLYFMEHEKTGAQLIYADNNDMERAFGVSFRTESLNDKGMPHVFEHSALAGSDKYPDSNLFFSMINQTYSTFLNAETHQRVTVYPIASLSEDQLFADMDVYMSGVLHPILLSDERAMMREAWHYNLDDPEGDITITGVVYSEMAANYSNMQFVSEVQLKKMLFPGSYTGNSFGGDPAVIPELTYQELLDFHAKYYHPSNMLMLLYGQFSDAERFLEHLDAEYLSKYDRAEIDFTDPGYTPAEGYQELCYHFPAPQNAGTDHASTLYYAFVLDNPSAEDYELAAIAASSLAADSSPLKQRMNQLFPLSNFAVMLDSETVQPTMQFLLMNANEADAPLFKQTIDEMLPEIMENDLDSAMMNMMINNMRYQNALASEGQHVGVTLVTNMAKCWAKTGSPDAYLAVYRFANSLERYQEDGSINTILSKVLKTSPASAMLIAVPEPGLAEKNDAALAEKLVNMKAAMSNEEVQALVDKCAEYNAWIESNATVSLIDQVKVVSAETLPEEYETAPVIDETRNGVRYITSEVPDSEVFKFSLLLDAQGLPFESLMDASLAVSLLSSIGTEHYTKEELQSTIRSKINMLTFSLGHIFFANGSSHEYLVLSNDGLSNQLDDTFRLMEEIVLRSDFSDYEAIRLAAAQTVTMADSYATVMPDLYMDVIGKAAVNPDYYMDYYMSFSRECRDYFDRISRMSDEELAKVVTRVCDVYKLMLNRPGAILQVIGSAENISRVIEASDAFLAKLGTEEQTPVDYSAYSTMKGDVAFVTDVSVAYNYIFFDMEAAGEIQTGQRLVAQNLVTDMILLPELRFRNNAYGAYNVIAPDISYLYTYRDPHVAQSYEVFRTVPEKLRNLELTKEQLDGYITSTYSSLVTPRGPITRAEDAVQDALHQKDPSRYLRLIREIKSTTAEDIRAAAGLYERICKEGTVVSGLSEEMLTENADMFDTVLRRSGN